MIILLCPLLPTHYSCQPEPAKKKHSRDLRRTRFLFGIAPGGACRAVLVAKIAVSSYLTVSPLPALVSVARPYTLAVSFLWRFPSGYPGRALPGTVAFWSPDFPRGHKDPATIRPSTQG